MFVAEISQNLVDSKRFIAYGDFDILANSEKAGTVSMASARNLRDYINTVRGLTIQAPLDLTLANPDDFRYSGIAKPIPVIPAKCGRTLTQAQTLQHAIRQNYLGQEYKPLVNSSSNGNDFVRCTEGIASCERALVDTIIEHGDYARGEALSSYVDWHDRTKTDKHYKKLKGYSIFDPFLRSLCAARWSEKPHKVFTYVKNVYDRHLRGPCDWILSDTTSTRLHFRHGFLHAVRLHKGGGLFKNIPPPEDFEEPRWYMDRITGDEVKLLEAVSRLYQETTVSFVDVHGYEACGTNQHSHIEGSGTSYGLFWAVKGMYWNSAGSSPSFERAVLPPDIFSRLMAVHFNRENYTNWLRKGAPSSAYSVLYVNNYAARKDLEQAFQTYGLGFRCEEVAKRFTYAEQDFLKITMWQ